MMNILKKFKGGIHSPDNKITSDIPTEIIPTPKRVILPVIQHIGVPSKPVVLVGDIVQKGQLIAEASAFVSANVHASISGKVTEIADFLHPVAGQGVESIFIEADQNQPKQVSEKKKDYSKLSNNELIDIIKNAGIVGMGGASFPTHVKLMPPDDINIDTVIINAAECEPYLTSDDRLMQEAPFEIIEGTKIVMQVLGASKAVIGIEDNKPKAIKQIKQAITNEDRIDIKILKTHYPQGSEKQLIKAILQKEVPSGCLPLNVGVVVCNVATAEAIYEAVVLGQNLISRIVTVTGSGIKQPKNLRIPFGTLVSDVIEYCDGITDDLGQVIMGGPMMGIAQHTLDVPIIKGTSGILFLEKSEVVNKTCSDCFRCGKCIRVCPMGLLPNMLSVLGENDELEGACRYHLQDCMECGSCAYVCPAKRPIVQHIKYSKINVNKRKK